MTEWNRAVIGEFFDLVTGYAFKSRDFIDKGIPVIKIKNVKAGEFSKQEFSYVKNSFLTSRMNKIAREDDLLISMSGNRHDGSPETWVGKICRFSESESYLINQRVGALRLKPGITADVRFFSFLLSGWPFQDHFIAIATSSGGQANLSPDQILCTEIMYPDIKIQKSIGSILGILDDKIALNHRMNETLEAMARALFKDWFVDFGPTRAKVEGRPPYLSREIWDLFPDALDDEDKPVGWGMGQASDLFKFNPRETIRKGTNAPYLDMAALPTTGLVPDAPTHREYKSGTKFRDGDTLFARITPCLENGKTAYVFGLGEGVVGAGSTEFVVIRSKEPVPLPISYLLARDPEFRRHAERSMTGTSGRQRANAEALLRYEFTLPSGDAVWRALGHLIEPMIARVIVNAHETRTLAQTRDFLLPKLMSGDIHMREAERIAADMP